MTPERWRQVEEVYQSAMDRDPDLRDAHLAEACGDDAALRLEVESLLRLNSTPVLVDRPAWQSAGELLDNESTVAAGTQLGPYRIEGVLGAGGMGQVYRASDTRLDRTVAIKMSREEFGERFAREARAVAALNHPNICTLHDVGPNYLVMELVEGPTLTERIRQGPIPLEEALTIARQIGDALEAAHERAIVHRDLKPGNIKVRPDGTVKVLDFGLAKRGPANTASEAKPEDSPTISMAATRAGVILGTAAYMSPEQARGNPVDKRADIWAFGVVLYEMVTGRQLFEGATVTDTLAAVLTKEPDWGAAPVQTRRLLQACLEREPKRRLRDVADGWRLVEEAPAPVDRARVSGSTRIAWIAAGLLAVVAVGALWGWWRTPKVFEKPLIRLNVDLGSDVALGTSNGPGPLAMLSPDGTRLIYISRSRIFTRRLDQAKAVELSGTEGAHAPFFSPDGQWIAFFTLGKLKKISVEGGAAIDLCDAFGTRSQGGDWSEDGKIVASLDRVVSQIPSDGGTPNGITELATGEYAHVWPQVLPGGNAVLFTVREGDSSSSRGSRIEVLSLKDRGRKTIQRGAEFGRYLPSGHLIYVSRETLYAVRFDLDRLEVRGSPAALLEDVTGVPIWMVSPAGTMVFYAQPLGDSTVQWLESNGTLQALLLRAGAYRRPRLSPDGQRLAMETGPGWSEGGIAIYDLQRKSITPLSSARGKCPIWSPDGQYVLFSDARRGGISWTRADGSGNPQPVTESKNLQYPYSFTEHGKRLAFMESNNDTAWDLWTVPVGRDNAGLRVAGKPEVLLQTHSDERHPVVSQDGRWLAYSSSASGDRLEIFVQPYPDVSTPGRRVQISSGGGVYPIWSPNGKELFFRTLDNRVMVAAYKVQNNSFVAENPRVWSEKRLSGGGATVGNYDLGPDGKRIVAILPADPEEDASRHHVTFVMNFIDEVRRRLP